MIQIESASHNDASREIVMFAFILTLMVMRTECAAPFGAGGNTEEKPPDLESENHRNYATAYYWDMYGALVALIRD